MTKTPSLISYKRPTVQDNPALVGSSSPKRGLANSLSKSPLHRTDALSSPLARKLNNSASQQLMIVRSIQF